MLKSILKQNGILTEKGISNNYKRILVKHPSIEQQIIDFTKFLDIEDYLPSMKERLLCIFKDITSVPRCPQCGKISSFVQSSYRTFCSSICAQSNIQTRNKHKQTMLKTYGVEYGGQTDEQKQKRKNTCLFRYGVDHHWKNSSIQQKRINTFASNYGVINPQQQYFSDETLSLLNDINWLTHEHHVLQKSCAEISNNLQVNPTTVSNYLHKYNIPIKHFNTSLAQREIGSFLQNFTSVELNNRTILTSGKEIDVFLPDYNIAIEYCGLYWHSDYFERNTKNSHLNKLNELLLKDIRLITIFEDEWTLKQDIVKLKLLAILGKDPRKRVFARQTYISNVSTQEKQIFFENTHIQGNGPSSINIGLYDTHELVACMGLIKQKNNRYIINRYSTSAQVVGGFSKLLTYFIKNYNPTQLVSFADRRWGEGNLYHKTGFSLEYIITPDYHYVVNHKRIHKFNFRHNNLKKILTKYDEHSSEVVNCKNNGIFRIWDCGLIKFTINTAQRGETQ
jgi:endogenous inhibitor of DNA gyrase (YacG/DUF329 family)